MTRLRYDDNYKIVLRADAHRSFVEYRDGHPALVAGRKAHYKFTRLLISTSDAATEIDLGPGTMTMRRGRKPRPEKEKRTRLVNGGLWKSCEGGGVVITQKMEGDSWCLMRPEDQPEVLESVRHAVKLGGDLIVTEERLIALLREYEWEQVP